MKLKVYILKKKQVIVAVSILFLLLISLIILISFKSKETIKNVNPVQTVHADVDGDKKIDTLYISTKDDNSYTVNVQTKKGDGFTLEPDPSFKTLGDNSEKWPMYIDCKDINGDSSQEIIIQGSMDGKPILHVYSYEKETNKMIKIASGNYSVFGSTLYNEEKVMMLGKNAGSKITFSYQAIKTTDSLTTPEDINLGNETLTSLASFISEESVDVVNTNASVLSPIKKGEFLDGMLIDVKYKNNIPYECTYQIRVNPYEDSSKTAFYEVKMKSLSYKNNSIQFNINNIKSID